MSWTIVNLPNVSSPQTQGQPGISVQVYPSLWKKIAEKHFAENPEFWKELLGEELFKRVKPNDVKAMIAATEKILPEIAKSMSTPLVLFHLVKDSTTRVWLCVLPSGLHVYIRRPHKSGQRYLASCHPKDKAEKLKQGLLGCQQRCVDISPGKKPGNVRGGRCTPSIAYSNRSFTLPHDSVEIPNINAHKETAHQITFIIPTQWGFESNEAGARWKIPAEYPEPLWELDPANPAKVVVEQ